MGELGAGLILAVAFPEIKGILEQKRNIFEIFRRSAKPGSLAMSSA